jgi:hypothetical protein
VHALEWIAQLTHCAVVALFRTLPPHEPPFDRILYGARILVVNETAIEDVHGVGRGNEEPWLAPWLGSLSKIDQHAAHGIEATDFFC